ncbi:MAG: DUF3014 domain-containing protein [Candidatus Aminicenantes bacterium]|nr:DUF3014 domain-containing protein [Candidatus Aminicenantes bacterium]
MTENEKDLNEEKIEEKGIAGETFAEEEIEVRKRPFPKVLFVVLILVIAAALYYFLIYKRAAKNERLVDVPVAAILEKELPPASSEAPAKPPVELDKSDDLVRRLAEEISTHPRLAEWLRSKDLIRRFVAAVDNIANGLSPRAHIDFFRPPGEFVTMKRGDGYVADPEGYSRYHTVVDVFVSLDSGQCVSLFRTMKPLCQEAYRDLGYPDQDFEQTILRAIVELMGTPVIEGNIYLEKAVLNYVVLDPALENLSDAQKHLLRMGPENVGAIQAKLREMALALGFPEDRLPKTRYYTPQIPER